MKLSALFAVYALFLLALPTMQAATNEELFAKANSEFAAGNFKAAVEDYNAVVSSGEWSANLFYDLGNAYFRGGDFGRAILSYDRALRLDRHHPEADANLRIAREQAHSLELMPPLLERYLNFATTDLFAIAAAFCFWLTIILGILRPRRIWPVIGGMFLTAICGFAAYQLENGSRGKSTAIVLGQNAEARVATADNAKAVLALPPGSEVLILQERGDWNYVALPNDQRGWIASSAVEKVRL
jgi:tetratricopeptide (TPR) repeat protein